MHGFINSFIGKLQNLPKPVDQVNANVPAPRVHPRWIPPTTTMPNVNIDVAVTKIATKGVAARIYRDNSGLYLGSSVVVYQSPIRPFWKRWHVVNP
jgi:hypothetical protein